MAFRTTSFRSNVLINNENNFRAGKEIKKLVTGPTLRRAALGDIGNKAALLQRSVSDNGGGKPKLTNNEPFKKPAMVKTRLAKKAQAGAALPAVVECQQSVVEEEVEHISVCESSMRTIIETPVAADKEEESTNTGVSSPKDMSVVESTAVLEGEQQEDEEEAAECDPSVDELSEAFSSKMLTVTDIDAEDGDNPQLVSEYVNCIYAYMRSLEEKHKVKRRYLEGHSVTSRMRSILMDWMVQVHMRFNLMQETLYLTFAILDRYLQVVPNTPKDELQLVGVTAMFVASKYEEMYCSEIGDFVYISDKAYSKIQIRRMEIKILKTLEFYISFPLPLHFLRRNSKAAQVDATQHALAKFLMELCQPDYNMCHYKASEIGAAALCLTMRLIGDEPEWTDTLVYYSGYAESHLIPIMCKMAQCITRSHVSKQQSINQKYRSSKHLKISEIPELRGPVIRSLAEKAATFS